MSKFFHANTTTKERIASLGSLSIAVGMLVGGLGFATYSGYQKIIIETHNDLIKAHQNKIIDQANSYNVNLKCLHQSIDQNKYDNLSTKLDQFSKNIPKLSNADIKAIKLLARNEGLDIELVDKISTEVLFDTREEYAGTILNKWERAAHNIKETQPGKIHYHFTWAEIYFYLFSYYQPIDSNYVWVTYTRHGNADSKIHQIVSYFKFDQSLREDFPHFGLFDFHLSPVHGLKNFPREIFRGINFDSSRIKKSGDTYYWIPIAPADENDLGRYIRYIGMSTNSDRYVEAKLAQLRYWLVGMVVFAWLAIIFLLYFVHKQYSTSLLRMSEQIKKCIAGEQDLIYLEQSYKEETRDLGLLINALVQILRKSEEKSRALANQIFDSCDNTQRKIHQDLHDTVGQLLVAANLKLAKYPGVADTRDLIKQASNELRTIYDAAEPPGLNTIGLDRAIKWYIIKFFPENFTHSVTVEIASPLNNNLLSQTYRITQEIIANARKHNHNISFLDVAIREQSGKLVIHAHNDCETSTRPLEFGNGLNNIKLRVEALAGHVTFTRLDGDFIVDARIPLSSF